MDNILTVGGLNESLNNVYNYSNEYVSLGAPTIINKIVKSNLTHYYPNLNSILRNFIRPRWSVEPPGSWDTGDPTTLVLKDKPSSLTSSTYDLSEAQTQNYISLLYLAIAYDLPIQSILPSSQNLRK